MIGARGWATVAAIAIGTIVPQAVAQQPPPGPAPATLTPGTLTVGVSLPTEGFQVGAVIGSRVVFAQGLEIDLARALARQLGVGRVRFVHEPHFDRLLRPADPPRWDVALAQATITAARRRHVAMSVPYLSSDQGVMLRRELAEPHPTSIADLATLRLCAQRGTTGAVTVSRRVRPQLPARLHAREDTMMQRLQSGACDAVVHDAAVLAAHAAAAPERHGTLVGRIATGERYGAILPKGSALVVSTNRALNALRRGGQIDAIAGRWLTAPPSQLPQLD